MFPKKTIILIFIFCFFVLSCYIMVFAEDEWLCSECGHNNFGNYCTNCGSPKPQFITCSSCGNSFSLEEHFRFCPVCGNKLEISPVSFTIYEGSGFDNPKEAVLYYIEGLKELNINKMLGAFAWETQAKSLNLDALVETIAAYQITSYPSFPNNNNFLNSLNIETKRSREITKIKFSMYTFLTSDTSISDPSMPITLSTIRKSEPVDNISEVFDMRKFQQFRTISDIEVYTLEELIQSGILPKLDIEQINKNYEKNLSIYGMDEAAFCIAHFLMGEEEFVYSADVARYGDRWYLHQSGGVIAAIIGIDVGYSFSSLPDQH